MGNVIVKEVTNKREFRKFVDYPNKLYKDVEQFVPAFYGDDLADWDKKKNPAFEYCSGKCFLAYRDGEIVGSVSSGGKVWILERTENGLKKTELKAIE